jgi:hypothetical protein
MARTRGIEQPRAFVTGFARGLIEWIARAAIGIVRDLGIDLLRGTVVAARDQQCIYRDPTTEHPSSIAECRGPVYDPLG